MPLTFGTSESGITSPAFGAVTPLTAMAKLYAPDGGVFTP